MSEPGRVIITGQTPSQKNAKRMAFNRRTGKPFPVTAKRVKEWQESAAWQLKGKKKYSGRVRLEYFFHVKDNRRRDIDNMIASINDALVKADIIEEDSWQSLMIGGANAAIDRENPRAEITIKVIE